MRRMEVDYRLHSRDAIADLLLFTVKYLCSDAYKISVLKGLEFDNKV